MTYELNTEALAQVKEMIYRAAAMRLVSLGSEDAGERPQWLNVRVCAAAPEAFARMLSQGQAPDPVIP